VYEDMGSIKEVDWSKVRDLTFNENRAAKRAAIDTIATSHCLECPDFVEHVFSRLPQQLIEVRSISRRILGSTKN
jgi:hypothetical protein